MMSLLFRMKLVVVMAMMFMMIVMAMIIVHDEGDSLMHFDQPLQGYDCTHFHVLFKLLLWRIFCRFYIYFYAIFEQLYVISFRILIN
jgi:hypothetical protein